MREVKFDKMQGLGNDYVYLICMETLPEGMPSLAKKISDRHFGVGGDGMVVITKSEIADFRMIMFNNDGSEAQMCGNASRCIARLVYEKGLTHKKEFTLETKAGIKRLKLNFEGARIKDITVNMGAPCFKPEEIPVKESKIERELTVHEVNIGGKTLNINCVGMGNPHGVIFERVSDEYFNRYGRELENHSIWPEKSNIEFVTVKDRRNIEMRVWERGTGETLACGTGACASAVAAIKCGLVENDVNVIMKGGKLNIRLNDEGEVLMTGDAEHVATGIYFDR